LTGKPQSEKDVMNGGIIDKYQYLNGLFVKRFGATNPRTDTGPFLFVQPETRAELSAPGSRSAHDQDAVG
jgi:hypothetical protein